MQIETPIQCLKATVSIYFLKKVNAFSHSFQYVFSWLLLICCCCDSSMLHLEFNDSAPVPVLPTLGRGNERNTLPQCINAPNTVKQEHAQVTLLLATLVQPDNVYTFWRSYNCIPVQLICKMFSNCGD